VSDHLIDPARIHHKWDNSVEPALVIGSGDTVSFDLPMAGRGQVVRGAGFERASFDDDTLYNLLGPIFVDGAKPGDTLEVEILGLRPGAWAWCGIFPGEGLLADDFPDPYLKTFELGDGSRAELAPGVGIPLEPFLGTMGTHPDEPGIHEVFPPHKGGGNIDARHLRQGATLWLPIWCDGGLFSCGDPHAAQGDGEVCVAALECDMHAVLRFQLRKVGDSPSLAGSLSDRDLVPALALASVEPGPIATSAKRGRRERSLGGRGQPRPARRRYARVSLRTIRTRLPIARLTS
jgi:acetamidase/formamidase